jgi:trehalose/maltose transport system substrate-binding protein
MTKAADRINRISPVSVLNYTESDSSVAFRSGGAAFLRHWSSAYSAIAASMKQGTAAIAPLPAGPARRTHTVGGFLIGVSAYTKHPEEAARLALYLTGRDVQRKRALRRGYMPTVLSLQADPEVLAALPQAAVFHNTPGSELVSRPSAAAGPKYAEVSRAYYLAVHQILSRETSAKAGLGKLEQSLMQITGLKPAGRE